jgi:pimeloyl-ACP methyl ester carboxylesterase
LSIWMKYGLGLLVIYVAYCGLLFIFQRQVLFPRGMIPAPAQSPLPGIPGLEKLWISTRFGRVEAWFLPPLTGLGQEKSPAVIFGHGNGELIDYWPEALSPFTRLGMAVLLVEYPGYGRSEGSPSQESVIETFQSPTTTWPPERRSIPPASFCSAAPWVAEPWRHCRKGGLQPL